MTIDVELMYLPFGVKDSGHLHMAEGDEEGEHRKRRLVGKHLTITNGQLMT